MGRGFGVIQIHLHQYTTHLLSLNVHVCKTGQHSPSLLPRVQPRGLGKPGAVGELFLRGPGGRRLGREAFLGLLVSAEGSLQSKH